MTPPRWHYRGDGEWHGTGGYLASLHTPMTDAWTLRTPDGQRHTGTAQECRQIAAQHAQENAA